MIAESIKREEASLSERGISDDSFWEVEFADNSVISEKEANWSELSEQTLVKFNDGNKMVMLSKYPIKKIKIVLKELETSLEIEEEDEKIYQAIKAQTIFYPGGDKVDRQVGRIVGRVKNGEVIEEKFLSPLTSEIVGFKK